MTTGRPVTSHQDQERSRESGGVRAAEGAAAAWLLVGLLGLAGFVVMTILVYSHVTFAFDQPLLDLARSWGAWTGLWRLLSESANIPLIVIGLGMVAWLFVTKRRREALVVLMLLIAITAGSEGVKQVVARPRPEGTDPNIPGVVYSFPSGHVLEALTIFGIIAIRCWRVLQHLAVKILIVALVVVEVAMVGVARVALSAHFPSDVLASLCGGVAALALYGWLTRPDGFADQEREPHPAAGRG